MPLPTTLSADDLRAYAEQHGHPALLHALAQELGLVEPPDEPRDFVALSRMALSAAFRQVLRGDVQPVVDLALGAFGPVVEETRGYGVWALPTYLPADLSDDAADEPGWEEVRQAASRWQREPEEALAEATEHVGEIVARAVAWQMRADPAFLLRIKRLRDSLVLALLTIDHVRRIWGQITHEEVSFARMMRSFVRNGLDLPAPLWSLVGFDPDLDETGLRHGVLGHEEGVGLVYRLEAWVLAEVASGYTPTGLQPFDDRAWLLAYGGVAPSVLHGAWADPYSVCQRVYGVEDAEVHVLVQGCQAEVDALDPDMHQVEAVLSPEAMAWVDDPDATDDVVNGVRQSLGHALCRTMREILWALRRHGMDVDASVLDEAVAEPQPATLRRPRARSERRWISGARV